MKKVPDEYQIIQLAVPSDIRGQPLERNGPIGLYEIRFNRSHWKSPRNLEKNSIVMVEGYELVIRRAGHCIGIFRRKMPESAEKDKENQHV